MIQRVENGLFQGSVNEAFDILIEKQSGYLRGVFHRADIGDIDLSWGDAPTRYTGYGVSHIIQKHINIMGDFEDVEEAKSIIADVINTGTICNNKDTNDRIYIEKGNYRVVIAKDSNGGKWLLSAFDYVKSKKRKEEERKEKRKTLPPSEPPVNQM